MALLFAACAYVTQEYYSWGETPLCAVGCTPLLGSDFLTEITCNSYPVVECGGSMAPIAPTLGHLLFGSFAVSIINEPVWTGLSSDLSDVACAIGSRESFPFSFASCSVPKKAICYCETPPPSGEATEAPHATFSPTSLRPTLAPAFSPTFLSTSSPSFKTFSPTTISVPLDTNSPTATIVSVPESTNSPTTISTKAPTIFVDTNQPTTSVGDTKAPSSQQTNAPTTATAEETRTFSPTFLRGATNSPVADATFSPTFVGETNSPVADATFAPTLQGETNSPFTDGTFSPTSMVQVTGSPTFPGETDSPVSESTMAPTFLEETNSPTLPEESATNSPTEGTTEEQTSSPVSSVPTQFTESPTSENATIPVSASSSSSSQSSVVPAAVGSLLGLASLAGMVMFLRSPRSEPFKRRLSSIRPPLSTPANPEKDAEMHKLEHPDYFLYTTKLGMSDGAHLKSVGEFTDYNNPMPAPPSDPILPLKKSKSQLSVFVRSANDI